MSELLKAVEEGNFQEVKRLIESGADIDINKGNALRMTARSGSLEIVKYLVNDHGADINPRLLNGEAALHIATRSGSLEIVKYLVEHGADINDCGGPQCARTALHIAATSGSLEIVKYLVEHGADINRTVLFGEAALHIAATSGSLEIVKYLVEHGADINCQNMLHVTALHCAVRTGSLEVVKYLVENGAKVTRPDFSGQDTVLWYACAYGNDLIVDYLFQHGAKEDLNTRHENSPLRVACSRGRTAVVQTLLKHNVDIRKECVLECGNDEIINILKHELKKSIKHREKIKILKTVDKGKMVKIGKSLECCTSETSFSLGKGSNGTSVYVGIMEDGNEVAVKRMLTQACEDSARNEIEILTRIDTKKSPYIVSYRDFLQDDTFMYLILDLCEETLKEHVHVQTAEYLKRHGPRMVKEMLTGLEFLHSQGILHRDLKPSNVLVDVAGHIRLADFGISRVLNDDETTVQTDAKGTRDWMPVEVVEAGNKRQKCRFKKKSDVQAVGMIAFFIFSKGDHPFGSSSVECMTNILKGQPVNLDKLDNFCARQFVEWLISHYITDRPYANEALRHSFIDQVEEIEILPKLIKGRRMMIFRSDSFTASLLDERVTS